MGITTDRPTDHQLEPEEFLHLSSTSSRLQMRQKMKMQEPVSAQKLHTEKRKDSLTLTNKSSRMGRRYAKKKEQTIRASNNKQRKRYGHRVQEPVFLCIISVCTFSLHVVSSITLVALCYGLLPACLRPVNEQSIAHHQVQEQRHHRRPRFGSPCRFVCTLTVLWLLEQN